jgi:pimeloyl-ACP methyl ester carboxylesterase
MVHGAFCGGWVFERFRAPFEAAGHMVLTPDLRGHGAADPPSAVLGASMADYARDIAELARLQATPPVLVGHSMGGLVAAMAAAKVKIAALVLLAPSPPWGIAGGSLEEAGSAVALYALGPFWAQAIEPDRLVAKLYSLDRMIAEEGREVARRMRPESGRAMFETLNWWLDPFMTTRVPQGSVTVPVFAGVGERDLINPPSTVRQTASKFGVQPRLFSGMSHWLVGEPGWEGVASACLAWLDEALARAA